VVYTGTVKFHTRIKRNGVRFPVVAFNPNVPGVGQVEIEAPNGYEIHATVHLTSVASPQDGWALAAQAHMDALDRLVFNYGVAVETPRRTGEQYWPPVAVGAFADASTRVVVVPGIDPAQLKAKLEQASPPGEHYYAFFREAQQSLSPVEEFMHLYHILLWLCNQQYQDEKQKRVDDFIKSEDPAVPQTPDPRDPSVKETVYTRLRNELGHKRKGVDLDRTKNEMGCWLPRLVALTKRAIELHP
jgi:hypothetical protein